MTNTRLLDTDTVLNMDTGGLKLIEASAGTGKTYTITNLYLRHVLEGRLPSQILVVTFTRAATEELRGRIRLRLYEALELLLGRQTFNDEFLKALKAQHLSRPVDGQQKQIHRLRHALAMMDQNAILTIHGFCQRIIQNFALPSLQYFDSEIINNEGSLWQKAINDWWRKHTYELDSAEWLLFNRAIRDYVSFNDQINSIREKTFATLLPETRVPLSEVLSSIHALAPDLSRLSILWKNCRQFIIEALKNSADLSRQIKLPYHKDNIDEFLDTIDKYFQSTDLTSIPDELRYLSHTALLENSKKTMRGSDSNLQHDFFHRVDVVIDRLEELVAHSRTTILHNAFKDCRKQVLLEKSVSQKLSYQDLIDYLLQAIDSDSGSQLAALIRTQYPVVMIDEFQDTDRAQYEIFSTVYFNHNDISLTLIGDPKQAIYSFRGGDIFTYMLARQAPAIQRFALATNWRSQPGLVEAVNHFFRYRADPFILTESIEFIPANAVDCNHSSILQIDSALQVPLTIWQIPTDQKNKPLGKEKAGELINESLASEIVSLLCAGQDNRARVDSRPLCAGDIAILVRTSVQGESIRKTLEAHGVSAITVGKDKVFDSDEAGGLALILNAIAHPFSRRIVRQAFSSELFYFNYNDIIEITESESAWQQWLENFHQLHKTWLGRGFIPMFQQMLQTFRLAEKLAQRNQAERRLTNLLHLGELLQQQSLISSGMDNLLNWFHQQRQNSDFEEAELRLESDDALVKIITIHKSKGLEYPVVFLPYMWGCYPVTSNPSEVIYYHDDNHEAFIDLGTEKFYRHHLLADRERLAEDLRLLYVALTRAQSKVYLAWGEAGSNARSGNSSQTALAYLLHSKQTADNLSNEPVNGISTPDTVNSELKKFVEQANGIIDLKQLPLPDSNTVFQSTIQATAPLIASKFKPRHKHSWRISSFSSLTQDVHQPIAASEKDAFGDSILNFPAGSRIGLFLHCIFEQLDFCTDIEQQCRDLIPRYAPKFGLEMGNRENDVILWVNEVVHTALKQSGLKLSIISNQQRLNELAFDFAVDQVHIDKVNNFFARRKNSPKSEISAQDFRGLVTGIIDLVFEYDGKYYLADYKSNYLGASLVNYDSDNLHQAMLDRRYDLQLLLYSLALHRYLRQRIRNYRYDDHFGGAYYLFLRAMRINNKKDYGIYFERPPETEIESFDKLFTHQPAVIQS